jgi:HAD superfamily hydrolase (TIGR01509 family)
MDGTLIETETRWWRAEIDVMEKHGSTWTTDDQNQAIGGPLQAVVDYMAAKAKADAKSIYDELVNEMFNSFTNNPPKLQPGWPEVLDEAVQENLKIALVTASNRLLAEALLKSTKLDRYFEAVVTSDDLPRTKPHPDPYLHAAEIFGLDVLECLAFEDSNTGISSSLAAGMPTIAVPERVLLDARRGMRIFNGMKGLDIPFLKQVHQELVKEWQEI